MAERRWYKDTPEPELGAGALFVKWVYSAAALIVVVVVVALIAHALGGDQ